MVSTPEMRQRKTARRQTVAPRPCAKYNVHHAYETFTFHLAGAVAAFRARVGSLTGEGAARFFFKRRIRPLSRSIRVNA